MMGVYGGTGWLSMLPMALLWLGLLFLVVWGLVSLFRWPTARVSQPSAQDILKERYARGEIDRPQFEQKIKELS